MSSMELNKLAGAAILSALVLMAIGMIGNALVHPRGGGVVVAKLPAPPTQAAPAAPAEPERPIGVLLAEANPADGAKVFRKCKTCHTDAKGAKNKIGPNLWNIVNAARGGQAGFSYSKALLAKEGSWTYESLDAFLTRPKAYIPKTKMVFAGLKKARDRADIIAYLRSLSDSPAPLP